MKKHQIYQVQIQAESLRVRRYSPETLMFLRLPSPADVIDAIVAIRKELEAVVADADADDEDSDQDYINRLEILEEIARRMRPLVECSGQHQHVSVAGTNVGQISYMVSEAWGD